MPFLFSKTESCPLGAPNKNLVLIVPRSSKSISENDIIGIGEFSEILNTLAQEETVKKEELASRMDNGNTNDLLTKVQTVSQNNYTEVSNEIAETNGFISDKVIDEFLKKDLNRPIAKTIALRETSPLPDKAKSEIENTELSDGLKNYLDNFQKAESPRKILEKEIKEIKNEKNRLISSAVLDVMQNDATGEYTNMLISELSSRYDMFTQEQVLVLQKKIKNYNNALNTISNMRSLTNNITIEEAEKIDNWLNVEEIIINIEQATDQNQKNAIISANEQFLFNIAENNNQKGQIKAQLILEHAGLAEFEEYTPLPDQNDDNQSKSLLSKNPFPKHTISNEKSDLLIIYPNPVKDILTVEYAFLANTAINSLGIYDTKGVLLMSIPVNDVVGIEKINVSTLSKGNYIISFGTNGISNISKQFIVE